VKARASEKARYIVLRAEEGDILPDALLAVLREHGVAGGWLRGTGVLTEIELRAYGADIGAHGVGRRVAGPAEVLVLDGTVGIADGDVSLGLRGVFARETDRGMEAISGQIISARVVALEAVVTAFDDVAMPRGLDPDAGVWLMIEPAGGVQVDASAVPNTPRAAPQLERPKPAAPPPRQVSPAWSEAVAASAPVPRDRGGPQTNQAMPTRPARPAPTGEENEGPFPEAGDVVEHFAFGSCEVLKSDGDRLHLKVGKDGRIREIALEMLRVTLLTSDGETQRYRLDRKM
jgi:predicted DNA-binding protein with PD1-like motif